MKIALHGSYHGHNFGDVLLMMIFRNWIKEAHGNIEVSVPFASDRTSKYIQADSNNGFSDIAKSAGVIYGGGGYFGEPPSQQIKWGFRNLIRHYPAGAFSQLLSKPYAIIGIGAGPITNRLTRAAMVQLCNRAKILAVRDEESKAYLTEYGVDQEQITVTADCVIQLTKEQLPRFAVEEGAKLLDRAKYEKIIGVHIQNFNYPDSVEHLKKEIVQFANAHRQIGIALLSDGFKTPDAAEELKQAIPNSFMVPYTNPWVFSALLSELDLVVTTKLHVGITATSLNTTTLAFPVHGKTERYYKQIGASDRCIPLKQLKKGDTMSQLQTYIDRSETPFEIPGDIIRASLENKRLVHHFIEKYARYH